MKEFHDTEKIAGFGLAYSFVTFILVYFNGVSQPVETLTSHAYGQGDMQLCGLYLNRTLFVSTLGFVPVAIIIYFSEPILISFGQD